MGYPTPEQWREDAAHARKMADAARAAGDHEYADRRDGDAAFYESRAWLEEWRIARMAPKLEQAA